MPKINLSFIQLTFSYLLIGITVAFSPNNSYSQCTGCTQPVSGTNLNLQNLNSNDVVCISGTSTIQNISGNGFTVCVEPGADVTFPNNFNMTSGTLCIFGTASMGGNFTLQNSNTEATIKDGGTFDVGGKINSNIGATFTVESGGTVIANEFESNEGTTTFECGSTIEIATEFYAHGLDTFFCGKMTVGSFRVTTKPFPQNFPEGACLVVAGSSNIDGGILIDGQVQFNGGVTFTGQSNTDISGSGTIYVVSGTSTINGGAEFLPGSSITFFDADTTSGSDSDGNTAANGFDNFPQNQNEIDLINFTIPTEEPTDCCILTPIQLGEFTVHTNILDAYLHWETLSEIGNSHFVIERSLDGVLFDEIQRIDGAGDSDEILTYSFRDKDAGAWADQLYYRLRQVDFDGDEAFSPVRVVLFESVSLGTKAFPNPIIKGNNLVIQSDNIQTVDIFDNNGNYLNTIEEATPVRSTSISTSDLGPGIYFAVINGKQTVKFVVQ